MYSIGILLFSLTCGGVKIIRKLDMESQRFFQHSFAHTIHILYITRNYYFSLTLFFIPFFSSNKFLNVCQHYKYYNILRVKHTRSFVHYIYT